MNRGLVGLVLSGYRSAPFKEIRRYAGHSQYANRKHTKEDAARTRALLFQQYRRKMALAVIEGGNANPNTNRKLAAVIEQAKKSNMPIASINAYLEKKCSDDFMMGYIDIRGPGNSAFVLQCQVVNMNAFKINVNHAVKKFRCKADPAVRNQFEHKGIICAEKNCNLDQAMEDAIHVGVEEVEEAESEGKKIFLFNCTPLFLERISKELLTRDYTILSAEEEFIPHRLVILSEEQLDLVDRLCERLYKEFGEQIVKINDNIDTSDDVSESK